MHPFKGEHGAVAPGDGVEAAGQHRNLLASLLLSGISDIQNIQTNLDS
jgi:hypothetical protein